MNAIGVDVRGTKIAAGLAGSVNIFNPEMIAVGAATEAGEFILEPARKETYLLRARSPSRDLEATLGPESGVLGGAALARHSDSGEYILGT